MRVRGRVPPPGGRGNGAAGEATHRRRAGLPDDLADPASRAARTVRFGVTEILYGIDAIRAFRSTVKSYAPRITRKVHITAFGRDFACTHLEYERVGTGLIGRETKIMARLPEHGWRVVSAHVSLLAGHDPGRTQKG